MTDTTASPPESSNGEGAANNGRSSGKSSLGDARTWERALYMLLYGVLGYFAFWAIILLAVIQFIVKLVTDEPNEDLRGFSGNLAVYLRQAADYMTFVSDDKIFPFAPFPKTDEQKPSNRPPSGAATVDSEGS